MVYSLSVMKNWIRLQVEFIMQYHVSTPLIPIK